MSNNNQNNEPISTASVSFTPAQNTDELLDRAVVADEEKRPVQLEELIPLADHHHPDKSTYAELLEAWNKILETWTVEHANGDILLAQKKLETNSVSATTPEEEEAAKIEPSFRRAALSLASRELTLGIVARLICDGSVIGIAFLLQGLVKWLRKPNSVVQNGREWEGFVWAIGIFLCQYLMLYMQAVSIDLTLHGLLKVQSALVVAVFEKTVKLRADTLAANKGQIIALHSSESAAIRYNPFLPSTVSAIPMFIAIVIALYFIVDLPGLTAIGVTLFFSLLQQWLSKKMSENRGAYLRQTDQRLKKVAEMIQGIRLVKLMSWEPSFEKQITELRNKEVDGITRLYWYRSWVIGLSHCLPPVMTLAVFGTYAAIYGNQNPDSVFPALVLLNVLRTNMTGFAMALSKVIDMLTSLDRYGRFLRLPERKSYVESCPQEASNAKNQFAIEMKNGKVSSGYLSKEDPRKKNEESNNNNTTKSKVKVSEKFLSRVKPYRKIQSETETVLESFFVPLLCDVQLNIKKGDCVAIVGASSSGKTQLLNLLLGDADLEPLNDEDEAEMLKNNGVESKPRITHNGSVAVVAQDPWIMNRTVRDNIVSDQEFIPEKYAAALINACLLPDLGMFPGGDKTQVGEKGIVTSGGCKCRISLAKSLYADKDIYMYDDVLSALDSFVGQQIVDNCLLGALKHKTRIFVTQHFQILPKCDRIIALNEQEIVFDGPYQEFSVWSKENSYSAGTLAAHHDHHQNEQNEKKDDDADKAPASPHTQEEMQKRQNSTHFSPNLLEIVTKNIKFVVEKNEGYFGEIEDIQEAQKDSEKRGKLTVRENIYTGSVSWRIYLYYWTCAGLCLTLLTQFSFAFWRAAHLFADFWLSLWTGNKGGFGYDHFSNEQYILWFGIASLVTIVAVTARQVTYTMSLGNVAREIHGNMLRRIIRAPDSFFHINTSGMIISRFSTDMTTCDMTVAEELMFTTSLTYLILSQVITIIIGSVYMTVVIVIVGILFHFSRVRYAVALRNIRRLENATRSPVLSIMNETVNGITAIRAYNQIESVAKRHVAALLDLLKCANSSNEIQAWISYRVSSLGSFVVLFMSLLVAVLRVFEGKSGVASLGNEVMALAISYAIALATSISYFIAVLSQVDASMSAIERIREFTQAVAQENDVVYVESHNNTNNNNLKEETEMIENIFMQQKEETQVAVTEERLHKVSGEDDEIHQLIRPVPPLPKNWPRGGSGGIEFKNVSMRYRPGLPLVLKQMTFTVEKGSKCAVIGRTGQGKSSCLAALFRLCEIESDGVGQILVDGRDIRSVKLYDLRTNIGILPQESLLFVNTLRANLDPFEEHCDDEIWRVIEKVGLTDRFFSDAKDQKNVGLSYMVQPSVLSNSERQLINLARQLLRKTPLLCLDEATSSTDAATDATMQKLFREEFKDATILTIAHRLSTVADYDKILVLKEGVIAESGVPHILLSKSLDDENALFVKMVHVLGENQEAEIRRIAKQHYDKTH